jgi:hypothetical protein
LTQKGQIKSDGKNDDDYDIPYDRESGLPSFDRKTTTAVPDLTNILPKARGPVASNTIVVCGKIGSGEHLDYSIHFAGNPMERGVNKCLDHITRGATETFSRCPILVYAMTKVANSKTTVDMTMAGITPALNAIIAVCEEDDHDCCPPLFLHPETKKTKKLKVQGVKVSCEPENGAVRFAEIEVPRTHPIFFSGTRSWIMDKLGMPLLVYHYPTTTNPKAPSKSADKNDKHTNPAAALMLRIDPSAPTSADGKTGWGTIPTPFVGTTSQILIVDADALNADTDKYGMSRDDDEEPKQPPLTAYAAQVACWFCIHKVQPMLKKSKGCKAGRKTCVANLTKRFWDFSWRDVFLSIPEEWVENYRVAATQLAEGEEDAGGRRNGVKLVGSTK